jgi:peroxiredoxin
MSVILRLSIFSLVALLLGSPWLAADESGKVVTLAPGAAAPDFNLPGVDGKSHRLADFADARLLAVVFTCNHCPSAQGAESRFKALAEDFAKDGLQMVAISPNDPESVRLNELGYSVYGDTLEEMKLHASEQGFTFPYLYDGETQSVSRAFGVTATPQIFLFDQARILRYVGRIDDSKLGDPSTIKTHDARLAIEALLAGTDVATPSTRAHGCSTKWAEKRHLVEEYEAKFAAKEVTLAAIDPAGVAKLRANPTDRYRLVNLWATWCGPCVAELPELVKIGRQFETRGFEFITISTDAPELADKVHAVLRRSHAAAPDLVEASLAEEGRPTNNYLCTGSTDELAEALDPEWQGTLPHTVLIAPGGEIVERFSGEVDPADLKRVIVARLGRFYLE